MSERTDSHIFLIKTNNEFCKQHYLNFKPNDPTDSGIDLVTPTDIIIPPTFTVSTQPSDKFFTEIDLLIICQFQAIDNKPHGYFLLPRSSFTKTPLVLANSVGLIDNSYRGTIRARVRNLAPFPFTLKKGECWFQLCAYDLSNCQINVVNEVSSTQRGSGGFGSSEIKAALMQFFEEKITGVITSYL